MSEKKKEELSDYEKDTNKQFTSVLNVFEELDEDIKDITNIDNAFQRIDVLCAKVKTLEIEVKRILTHLSMKTNKEAWQNIQNFRNRKT